MHQRVREGFSLIVKVYQRGLASDIMQLVQCPMPTTPGNLAVDEWMLSVADASMEPLELIRIWENPAYAVVMGRSSRIAVEVDERACRERDVGIFRRSSGGAAVVIGPGCLMYSLVIDYRLNPSLRMLDAAHCYVMKRMQKALLFAGVRCDFRGTCDLTIDGKKFSGNSLRCARNAFLYHGTILGQFPLELIQDCLGVPPRQPEYRSGRNHREFVCNTGLERGLLEKSLLTEWCGSANTTVHPLTNADLAEIRQLADTKYSQDAWIRAL
jgi:lipoate---protein ligase